MARQQFPLDRSGAFTYLLELDPDFGQLDLDTSGARITEFLTAWYESDSKDMFAFCREWLAAEKAYTISTEGRVDWLTLDGARDELGQIAKLLDALTPGQSIVLRRHK